MNRSVSSREEEVLYLISIEMNNRQIAKELYISTHTVISHRRNLLSKLQVKNVAGLVRKGFELGLLKQSMAEP